MQNTRKVTRALEMVSASKIRKAQELMRASRPYARADAQVIGHIAQANSEYKHPFMVERATIKRVGYIVVSTDRGLCGGLNSNCSAGCSAKSASGRTRASKSTSSRSAAEGAAFFRRLKVNMVGSRHASRREAAVAQLIGVIKVMLDAYSAGRIDRAEPRLQRFRQHDDAEADDRPAAAAAAVGHALDTRTTGITCTSPMRKRCWTTC